MLSQRRPFFDFPSIFRTILRCLEDYISSNACLVIHGQFIKGSALREILEACSLATIGVGALVDVNEIKRARCCVQVTLCSLYQKLVDAVKADGSTLDLWKWIEEKSLSSSMVHYWSLVINL